MQFHDLKPIHKNKKAKQVGRGGKRGKTSGKGHKGQKARAGTRMRPAIRDMVKSLPKLKGHSALKRDRKSVALNVSSLERHFEKGDTVSPSTLQEKGLVKKTDMRKQIKILGNGELTKKLTIERCAVSGTAKSKIEKSGGAVS